MAAPIPRLTDTDSNTEIILFNDETTILTFTLKDASGATRDLSSGGENLTATDFHLSAAETLGGVAIFSDLQAAYDGTSGANGKILFSLTPTQLPSVINNAVMEVVDNTSGIDRLAQRKYNVCQGVQP